MQQMCNQCPGRKMKLTPEQEARVEALAAAGEPIACHPANGIAYGDIGDRPALPEQLTCVWAEMLREEFVQIAVTA